MKKKLDFFCSFITEHTWSDFLNREKRSIYTNSHLATPKKLTVCWNISFFPENRKYSINIKRRRAARPQHQRTDLQPLGYTAREAEQLIRYQARNRHRINTRRRHHFPQAFLEGARAPGIEERDEPRDVQRGGLRSVEAVGDGSEGKVRVGGRIRGVEVGVEDGDGEASGVEDPPQLEHWVHVALEW